MEFLTPVIDLTLPLPPTKRCRRTRSFLEAITRTALRSFSKAARKRCGQLTAFFFRCRLLPPERCITERFSVILRRQQGSTQNGSHSAVMHELEIRVRCLTQNFSNWSFESRADGGVSSTQTDIGLSTLVVLQTLCGSEKGTTQTTSILII